jgi:ATP-binding cassette subfamily B protein
MTKPTDPSKNNQPKKPGIFSLLKPYMGLIVFLIILSFVSTGVTLLLPKIIGSGIDAYTHKHFVFKPIIIEFTTAVIAIFIFTYMKSIIQTYE